MTEIIRPSRDESCTARFAIRRAVGGGCCIAVAMSDCAEVARESSMVALNTHSCLHSSYAASATTPLFAAVAVAYATVTRRDIVRIVRSAPALSNGLTSFHAGICTMSRGRSRFVRTRCASMRIRASI